MVSKSKALAELLESDGDVVTSALDNANISVKVYSVKPTTVTATGTTITIIGEGFVNGATVHFVSAADGVQTAAASVTFVSATKLTITGYLGSTTVSVPVTSTVSNSSVERLASDINAVTELTGVEAFAVTKAELYSVSKTGAISFKMMGNRPHSGAETNYKFDIAAQIADTSDLSPLIQAINAQSANTGITAAVGATAASNILTHATGEDIEIDTFVLDTTTSGNMSMRALDKYGNNLGAADITLNRTLNTTLDDTITVGSGSANGLAVGHMTLTSIKSFVVAGDDTTAEEGYFAANNYSGSAAGGGSARLSAVSAMTLDTQEHATDAIATLDGAIAKIDGQRAALGAISNRLSHVVDNNTAMITNTESSKSHILDTDFAVETTKLTRTQILQQAATSMLAQSNASKQSVLALLQNLG